MAAIKLITGAVQCKFPSLDTTEVFDGVDTGKYAATFLVDPKDVKPLQDAIKAAGGGRGNNPLSQIPDDAKYDPGMWRFKAKSKFPVKVVDKAGAVISNDSVPNATVRASVNFAEYQAGPNVGVTAYLQGIQVLEAGGSDVDFGPLPDGYEPGADLDDPLPF